MTCLDDTTIATFLEGADDDEDRGRVFEHLAECEECRSFLSQLANALPPTSDEPRPELVIVAPTHVESAPTLLAKRPRPKDSDTAAETPRALCAARDPSRKTPTGDSLLGRQVGNFRITGFIGSGAMGAVYEGEHVLLGHRVAIKVMQIDRLDPELQAQAIERFVTEARALTEIKDVAHVIQLHDFGRLDEGRFYYVMEHLEGRTLEHELQRRGRLAPSEALPLVEQICAGLEAAHRSRVLHRDLKPANIFVVEGEPSRIKLIDFGLAKRLGGPSTTLGGLGSPLYAPPELVLGQQDLVGPASDLYSVGMILYRMLSGALPFEIPPDSTVLEVFQLPTRVDPLPLRARRPEVPEPIAALVDRCLRRDPRERPRSAALLAAEFSRAIGKDHAAAPTRTDARIAAPITPIAPTRRRSRRRARIAIASCAVIAGIAALGVLAGRMLLPTNTPPSTTTAERKAAKGARASVAKAARQSAAVEDLLHALAAEVFVSSQAKSRHNKPEHLVDGLLETAWNSRSGDLQGAWIAFRLPRSARVTGIRMTPGFTRIEGGRDFFAMNHRIARVRILRDGKLLGEYALDIADRGLQRLPVDGPGGEFRLEILATVAGTKPAWREVCVSELQVQGELPPGRSPAPLGRPIVHVGYDAPLAASLLASETISNEAASRLARRLGVELGEPGRRPLARALIVRGNRLEGERKEEDALELYLTAAELDPSDGTPLFSSARLYAIRGDRDGCIEQLVELKSLGRAQNKRLHRALTDESFASVRDDPRFKALYP